MCDFRIVVGATQKMKSRPLARQKSSVSGAQQNFRPRPIGADGAQQAAQEALGLLSAGAPRRPQHGGDEAAGAVEHDDRLKTIFVVMRVEEA